MASDNKTIVKEEVIDVGDYDPEVYGPPPKLPRKYYGTEKLGDQEIIFFYDLESDDETDATINIMTGPLKVKVKKVNENQFMCVTPSIDEASDEATTEAPMQQIDPQYFATFSLRQPPLEVNATPQRRFLDTRYSVQFPSTIPTISVQAVEGFDNTETNDCGSAEIHEATEARLDTETTLVTTNMSGNGIQSADDEMLTNEELEARLIEGIPELTEDDIDFMFSATPY